jgi:hypothetical protein
MRMALKRLEKARWPPPEPPHFPARCGLKQGRVAVSMLCEVLPFGKPIEPAGIVNKEFVPGCLFRHPIR